MKTLPRYAISLGVLLSLPALAEQVAEDLVASVPQYHVDYYLNADGSFQVDYRQTEKALQKKALESLKQAEFSYSTSIETAEIIEAYTLKADGRKIQVPKTSFQREIHDGNQGNTAVFSDTTTMTVVFPEVAVGDSVTLHYRLKAKEPIFPHQFSLASRFSKRHLYEDVRIAINAPDSLPLRYQMWEFQEQRNEHLKGRHLLAFTWNNLTPLLNHRKDYSVYHYGEEPGLLVSTFASYQEIAQAYGQRATPKAAVTPRIRQLADDIVQNRHSREDIVRSLYDWVAVNISYAGNCVGLGQVVPRDTDFVLDNRMGDCKDHATLLQALMAAKGIHSTQALVNASALYQLPEVPVVSSVNHVINYIPDMNLFLDATSPSTPYGMLPFGDQDKPVLLVDGFVEHLKTPGQRPGQNLQTLKATQTINVDGSMQGSTQVELRGTYAVDARDSFRDYSKDKEKDIIKNSFKANNAKASGQFNKQDAMALLDTYQYAADYQVKDYYQFNRVGVIDLAPVFWNYAEIEGLLAVIDDEQLQYPMTCNSGKSVEEIDYQLPESFEILSVPDSMELSNNQLSYQASYQLDGQSLKMRRSFEDNTQGNVCSAETLKANNELLKKARRNYTEQVVYRQIEE